MDDEERIEKLIAGFRAINTINSHADNIAYAHPTIWHGCHPCRVRAAAWLRGTPEASLPEPCPPIRDAQLALFEAKEVARSWDGTGF